MAKTYRIVKDGGAARARADGAARLQVEVVVKSGDDAYTTNRQDNNSKNALQYDYIS